MVWLPIGGTSPRGKQDPLNLHSYNYPLSAKAGRAPYVLYGLNL